MSTSREVLLVVPRRDVRDAIADFWRDAGYDVATLASVRDGKRRLMQRAPALIVLDLGSAAGWSLLTWLRAHEALEVPVVALVRRAQRIPGVLAAVSRPLQLAPWLRVYERLTARNGSGELVRAA